MSGKVSTIGCSNYESDELCDSMKYWNQQTICTDITLNC